MATMRKVFTIALNVLLRSARDRRALIMLLAMPLILIGILGNALKGVMGDWKLDPFPLLVVNSDQGAAAPGAGPVRFGTLLTEQVLGSDDVKKYLKSSAVTDLAQAKQDVAAGKAVAVIYVPPTFTADVLAGKPAAVEVATDPGQSTQAGIVMQVVRGFTEDVTSGALTSKVLGPAATAQAMRPGTQQSIAPKIREVAPGARPVSAMQYYAAAMAAMFMVMTAFARAKDIILERQQGTLSRMLTSPTPRSVLLAGQILGNAVVGLAQFIVLMAGTRLFYGVDWGNWGASLLVGAAFAVAVAGVGAAAAAILNDPKAADAGMGIAANLFGMLSGAMMPVYNFTGLMKLVAQVIPNYWALKGFLDIMAGLSLNNIWLPVAILIAVGAVTGTVGAWGLASR
jgi:ABC-2 type transport system permease protein